MTRYQHVIWDWNGTLLDDIELCIEIVNDMLRRRAMSEIDIGHYREIFDFPVIAYYETLGFDFSLESFAELAHEYCEVFDRRVSECSLHAGVAAILDRVGATVPRQSILSSSEQQALNAAVTNFGLAHRFDRIVGLSHRHATGKVENGQALVSAVSAPLASTVLIGDTLHDAEVSQALGIDCILVANGHHSRRRLETTRYRVVDDLAQVLGLLA